MRPSRRRFSRCLIESSFGLALFVSCFAAPVFAAPKKPKPTASAAPASLEAVGVSRAALAPLAAEKTRVPREKEKPKSNPDSPASNFDDDDESPCISSCFDGCFFGGASSSPPPPPPAAVALVPLGWKVYDHGWFMPNTPGDSLILMEGPVAPDRPDVSVGVIHDGEEVVVMEIHELPAGIELRVRPVDRLEPIGWVAGSAISPAAPGSRGPTGAPVVPPPWWEGVEPTPWGLQLVAGWGSPLSEELVDEYGNGGFHGELYYLNFGRGIPKDASPYWGAGVGFSYANGTPTVDYVTFAQVDRPYDSNLRILDFAAEGGLLFCSQGGLRGRVSLGPALFLVHESAGVYTYDATMTTQLGVRVETLDRAAGGGVMRLGVGWRLPSKVELGFQIDAYAMAWTGHQEQSLTTDFMMHGLGGMDIALSVTFPEP